MTLRQTAIAAIALFGGVRARSCCFVVQDQAHEVFWKHTVTQTYVAPVDVTSVTALVTPYAITTITNFETNVYHSTKTYSKIFTVTDNPVALYSNPVPDAVDQTSQVLAGASTVTGGVEVAAPTGFWVYSTAKIFEVPAVTDSLGNAACGTLSVASNPAATDAACIPTFTGINSNAEAFYAGDQAPAVEITLSTPFIHVPTRAALPLVRDAKACAQGDGTQNYGYPAQELINHLAGNPDYQAQYPGIENCLPAGPRIQAARALVELPSGLPVGGGVGLNPPAISVTVTLPGVGATVSVGPPVEGPTETPIPTGTTTVDPGNTSSSTSGVPDMLPTTSSGLIETPIITGSSSSTPDVPITTSSTQDTPVTTSSTQGNPGENGPTTTSSGDVEVPIPTGSTSSPTTDSATLPGGSNPGGVTPTDSTGLTNPTALPVEDSTAPNGGAVPTDVGATITGISTTVQGGQTTVIGGTTTSIDGSTTIIGGTTSVIGGTTIETPFTSIIGSGSSDGNDSGSVVTASSNSTSSAGSPTSTGPLEVNFAQKGYVSWNLLSGLFGLIALGLW